LAVGKELMILDFLGVVTAIGVVISIAVTSLAVTCMDESVDESVDSKQPECLFRIRIGPTSVGPNPGGEGTTIWGEPTMSVVSNLESAQRETRLGCWFSLSLLDDVFCGVTTAGTEVDSWTTCCNGILASPFVRVEISFVMSTPSSKDSVDRLSLVLSESNLGRIGCNELGSCGGTPIEVVSVVVFVCFSMDATSIILAETSTIFGLETTG